MMLWKTEQPIEFIEHITDNFYVSSAVVIYSGTYQVFLDMC